ncbi:Golgin subfamily A member 7/ERF4 family-domain-containing protein [Terfezia claveryi]|nr:Golgin subfamily A member 7/ERF4 family-domain-containing protein [Terfezia claveryi]
MLGVDGTRAGGPDARSSSSRPSTLHEEEEEDDWNHEHPCFPHPNPHVPLDSPLFQSTRIIRIPRDYMINGDNTPAFSIVYPVILEPYVTEEQFRKIVDTVNEKLRLAFDPWNKWNWVDALCGLATLWFWEEVFPTYVKRRLREVEKILEEWNVTLKEQGARLIPLRRSAYITVSEP